MGWMAGCINIIQSTYVCDTRSMVQRYEGKDIDQNITKEGPFSPRTQLNLQIMKCISFVSLHIQSMVLFF